MKTEKRYNAKLTLILALCCFIFSVQPTQAAITYGDVSSDGDVTAYDAALTAQNSVGLISLTPDQVTAADVSGDNEVTAYDAALIAQYTVGLITKFPAEDKSANNILVPGTGFTGPTAQPDPVGEPAAFGYSDNAITRWDVVPYQTFSGNFNVGVVAFHNSGIDHVSFSVNGGMRPDVPSGADPNDPANWVQAKEMTANPQTANTSGVGVDYDASGRGTYSNGVVEYWATLRAGDFAAEGPIEVRAIAYPKVGVPRMLPSLPLNVNADGALTGAALYVATNGSDTAGDGTVGNPFATILRATRNWVYAGHTDNYNNATIYLAAGTYILTSDPYPHDEHQPTGWLTITPAPGVARTEVIITQPISGSGVGIMMRKLHWKNVTIMGVGTQFFAAPGGGGPYYLWIDGVNAVGPGREMGYQWISGIKAQAGIYINDSSFSESADGIWSADICRNVLIDKILSDAFRGVDVIINNLVTNVTPGFFGTNLTVDAIDTTLVTPDGYTPIAENTNEYYQLSVTGGPGWTAGTYTITAIVDGKWRLDRSPAATGTTGGQWQLMSGAHSDVYQYLGGVNDNKIFYGLSAPSIRAGAGLSSGSRAYSSPVTDFAIVNSSIIRPDLCFYFGTLTTNMFVKNSLLDGFAYWWTPGPTGFEAVDVVFEDSIFTRAASGFYTTAGVTYRAPVPTAISIAPTTASLTAGGFTRSLTATILDRNSYPITATLFWASSDTTVATVSSAGVVTPIGAGTATITASSGGVTSNASVVTVAPYDNSSLSEGLVAYYPFDGDTSDHSGNGNNGTPVGGPTYVTERSSQALSLNGTSQYVTTNASVGTVFTFSVWLKHNGTANTIHGIFKSGGKSVYINGPTNFINIYDAGYVFNYPPPAIAANTWGFLTIVSDGNNYIVYINGTLYKSYGYAAGNWTNITLGVTDNYFNGSLDDVRIYNRALSADEVQHLYTGGN